MQAFVAGSATSARRGLAQGLVKRAASTFSLSFLRRLFFFFRCFLPTSTLTADLSPAIDCKQMLPKHSTGTMPPHNQKSSNAATALPKMLSNLAEATGVERVREYMRWSLEQGHDPANQVCGRPFVPSGHLEV